MNTMLILLSVFLGDTEGTISVQLGSKENVMSGMIIQGARDRGSVCFLGTNGELLFPSGVSKPFMSALSSITYTEENGSIRLWLPIVSRPFAEVSNEGFITLLDSTFVVSVPGSPLGIRKNKTIQIRPELLPEFPSRWPFKDCGVVASAPQGTLLCKSLEESLQPPQPPINAKGWLLLGWDGSLSAPPQKTPIPANVLWVVTDDMRKGFDLVHGGPLHSGVYARVYPDGEMRFGDAETIRPTMHPFAQELAITKDDSIVNSIKCYWSVFSSRGEGELAMLPPGYIISPSEHSLREPTIFTDESGENRVYLPPIRVE